MMFLLSMPSGGEWIFLFLGFFLLIGLIPFILYLVTLQRTLQSVSPANRTLEPGMVWLMFIPLFNLVWQFIVVSRIDTSLNAEFRARGAVLPEKSVQSVGLAYCICFCCSWIPLLGTLASIAGVILWIIYWVKVNDQKHRLLSLPPAGLEEHSLFNL